MAFPKNIELAAQATDLSPDEFKPIVATYMEGGVINQFEFLYNHKNPTRRPPFMYTDGRVAIIHDANAWKRLAIAKVQATYQEYKVKPRQQAVFSIPVVKEDLLTSLYKSNPDAFQPYLDKQAMTPSWINGPAGSTPKTPGPGGGLSGGTVNVPPLDTIENIHYSIWRAKRDVLRAWAARHCKELNDRWYENQLKQSMGIPTDTAVTSINNGVGGNPVTILAEQESEWCDLDWADDLTRQVIANLEQFLGTKGYTLYKLPKIGVYLFAPKPDANPNLPLVYLLGINEMSMLIDLYIGDSKYSVFPYDVSTVEDQDGVEADDGIPPSMLEDDWDGIFTEDEATVYQHGCELITTVVRKEVLSRQSGVEGEKVSPVRRRDLKQYDDGE